MVVERHTVYKHNSIDTALMRIDFPVVLELENEPSELKSGLIDRFPEMQIIPQKAVSAEMPEVGTGQDPKITVSDANIYVFFDKNKKNKIELTSSYIVYEVHDYIRFSKFYEEFNFIIQKLCSVYQIKIFNRVGLRYINKIVVPQGNPFDWTNIIDSNLTTVSSNFIEDKNSILRSMQLLEMKHEDGILRFQFGQNNSEYPAPIVRREFILDYDYFSTEEVKITELYDLASHFNKTIFDLFKKSIGTQIVNIMEEIDDDKTTK